MEGGLPSVLYVYKPPVADGLEVGRVRHPRGSSPASNLTAAAGLVCVPTGPHGLSLGLTACHGPSVIQRNHAHTAGSNPPVPEL